MTQGFVVWLTGLSGAGKSTIAKRLRQELAGLGRHAEVLDGDEIRTHLSRGLGYSKADRDTNIRRIGYVARLVARSGGVAIAAAISPYREIRDELRAQTPGFVEVYVRCALDELVRRDVKGLYMKALAGEITNFTGVDDPYEPPLRAEVTVDSGIETVEESVEKILVVLDRLGHIRLPARASLLEGDELAAARDVAARLPRLDISQRDHADLFMLAVGALAPICGFMNSPDYRSVIDRGRLATGQPFTIPVVLRVGDEEAGLARRSERLGLWLDGQPAGILQVEEVFCTQPEGEALRVYGTDDLGHPGVNLLKGSGRHAVAGPVLLLARPLTAFPEFDLTPAEVRAAAAARGWRTVVGFQTRNPVHRAHEYLTKVALESVDGLLLHPLVGETKAGDIPADVRMRCYQALVENYYPADRVLLSTNPAWMRYGGPKEAVFHAIVRRNYGCTHFIVGRDHAGVGDYYDTYAAHRIIDEYGPGELGIEILRFDNTFWCGACLSMASTRSCPHPPEARLMLSGTRVRELLEAGEELPAEFTRPEVAAVLREAYARA